MNKLEWVPAGYSLKGTDWILVDKETGGFLAALFKNSSFAEPGWSAVVYTDTGRLRITGDKRTERVDVVYAVESIVRRNSATA